MEIKHIIHYLGLSEDTVHDIAQNIPASAEYVTVRREAMILWDDEFRRANRELAFLNTNLVLIDALLAGALDRMINCPDQVRSLKILIEQLVCQSKKPDSEDSA
ncbi:hypothetical protein ACKTEK_04535 [Tepidamorphus sp. 3E244]|uniref:hypothetical protein n=1 Tax=Tepidamorphus sp. 3E244 TaxID=3385498 RepID=UPI0038FCC7B4